jgi:ATP phosphoribosyltransferase regulatory subunit
MKKDMNMIKFNWITPEGTRDKLFDECAAEKDITDKLRVIFEDTGYREVKTPGFEFYDVFASNSNYYPQENMYTLSDPRGRLMTVRPDSTIPIARMTATKLKGSRLPIKLFYTQNVFRQQPEHKGKSSEIMQMGIELIGDSSYESDVEMLTMAIESMKQVATGNFRIEIGHVGIYKLLMDKLKATSEEKESIHRYVASKNYAALNDILDRYGQNKTAQILKDLPGLFGGKEALRKAEMLTDGYDSSLSQMISYLDKVTNALQDEGTKDNVMIDFGLVNQADYYSSLIFNGYMESTGEPVLSGGRYDNLFSDFDENYPATGFALNVDLLTVGYLDSKATNKTQSNKGKDKLRIALTKGRLEDSFVNMLENAGYDCNNIRGKGRKLLLTIPGTNVEVFLAKAPDVITYVEHGVCDIGIVGKDTVSEYGGTYYEILDLGIGKCRFALATPKGQDFFRGIGTRRVATKYPAVAGEYFEKKGMDVDIIKIEGSVELAPLLALADGIVDIVETGTTLKENGLEVVEDIKYVSARLIVNVTSMKMKKSGIDEIVCNLKKVIK